MRCPDSTDSPVPQTLDPFLKLFGRLGVDLPCQLCLVVILHHAGVVFYRVRGSCGVASVVVVTFTSMHVDKTIALRHLEAMMHVNDSAKRLGLVLYTRNKAAVEMERSGEGSEEASEGEKEGRGAPFYVRRRHDTTRHDAEARAGGCDNGRKSEVVKRPSISHTIRAWRCRRCLAPEPGLGRKMGAKPERADQAAKMRLKLNAEAPRIGRIFAVTPLNFIKSTKIINY